MTVSFSALPHPTIARLAGTARSEASYEQVKEAALLVLSGVRPKNIMMETCITQKRLRNVMDNLGVVSSQGKAKAFASVARDESVMPTAALFLQNYLNVAGDWSRETTDNRAFYAAIRITELRQPNTVRIDGDLAHEVIRLYRSNIIRLRHCRSCNFHHIDYVPEANMGRLRCPLCSTNSVGSEDKGE